MAARSIIIWALVIIVIIGGISLYWAFGRTGDPTTQATQQEFGQVAGEDITVGTGAEAAPGTVISVLYVGMLEDGSVFDSSEANGNQPLVFVLGSEGIIPGFQIGVNGMREGGVRRIAIPPEFGYGSEDVTDEMGNVIIPANSTLIFDVNLVSVQSIEEFQVQAEEVLEEAADEEAPVDEVVEE